MSRDPEPLPGAAFGTWNGGLVHLMSSRWLFRAIAAHTWRVDMSALQARELLALESEMLAELRRRGLVRTNNKPLGDIAESVVLKARGGILEPNSTKSHDVTDAHGARIQVKAMGARAAGRSAKFSAFRSFDFDSVVFLAFDPHDFSIAEAWEVSGAAIAQSVKYVAHIAGRQPTLTQVRSLGASVLPEMSQAWEAVNTFRSS